MWSRKCGGIISSLHWQKLSKVGCRSLTDDGYRHASEFHRHFILRTTIRDTEDWMVPDTGIFRIDDVLQCHGGLSVHWTKKIGSSHTERPRAISTKVALGNNGYDRPVYWISTKNFWQISGGHKALPQAYCNFYTDNAPCKQLSFRDCHFQPATLDTARYISRLNDCKTRITDRWWDFKWLYRTSVDPLFPMDFGPSG